MPYGPPRAASVQRCVRAGGKHNDLDAIGRSLRHLSFFEMLGNFSFGDYFKAEAIAWAWEFVTEVLELDGDRLWVTVHESDDEAEDLWADEVGFPRERIQRLGKDNFWEMGDTGPCGPSSEIFWDNGPDLGPEGGPANPAAEDRYVEIWNLVFPQYLRGADGSSATCPARTSTPAPGLERILAVLAGSPSLYAADTLPTLVDEAQSVTGHRLGESELGDIALRLMADHARTMTFLVADGVIPSNEDRGYVLRRIIRRAIRFAYLLGVERPVLPAMVERTIDVMGDAYPERRRAAASWSCRSSPARRSRSGARWPPARRSSTPSSTGSSRAAPCRARWRSSSTTPTASRSRSPRRPPTCGASTSTWPASSRPWRSSAGGPGRPARAAASPPATRSPSSSGSWPSTAPPSSPGATSTRPQATVVGIVGRRPLPRPHAVLRRVGRPGRRHRHDRHRHRHRRGGRHHLRAARPAPAHVRGRARAPSRSGQTADARIDAERRDAIRRNHTGTHILHWALREVLGTHVKQQGSLVAPDRLRFDFSHFEPVTPDQIRAIEDLANREILDNAPVRHFETTMNEARELGAIAFFGDKYGDIVRVLEAGRALGRAVRRHPRPPARRHRARQDRVRGVDRVQPAAHRGGHRPRADRAAAPGGGPDRPGGRRAGHHRRRPAAGGREAARRAQGAARTRSRRCGARPRAAGPPSWRPPRSTAWSSPGSTAWPATRCATWRSPCASSPASGLP